MNDMSTIDTSVLSGGISIQGLRKRYHQHDVFKSIDLNVERGTFVCLLGPSGCGKTTLLRCLAGLIKPDAGLIGICGQAVYDGATAHFVEPENRALGMVFQNYALWPHMTVRKNIKYPLDRHRIPSRESDARIQKIARLVGIEALLDRYPAQISGGQQQRVALARALVNEPKMLLLDEPLSNLDASLRAQLRRDLRQVHERLGMTTVLVTHDQEEAAALADLVVVMLDGGIVQKGRYEEIMTEPANKTVARFVGYDNLLPVSILRQEDGVTQMRTDGGEVIWVNRNPYGGDSAKQLLALRGDSLSISETRIENALSGHIRRRTSLGHTVEVELDCSGNSLIARVPATQVSSIETQNVWVGFDTSSPLVPIN
ncbi:ABC-type Fe3+/spermidine/putrescine transport system ATPase subunit [Neorhizobium galegae]|uniref:ABC transporter ATP-binding protein n=1 Tax=Neorhizobium galegae TaxID=399 RepID=UPI002781219E|nr:ABC transporter ATP-binding protein [Neorhizobium galegae]MDQ0137677.1 ABC-type Fe3+/spermidine/putrescine transport system ATPase subunit [Neorhizobium galegae]